jgi:hypothetical protein
LESLWFSYTMPSFMVLFKTVGRRLKPVRHPVSFLTTMGECLNLFW